MKSIKVSEATGAALDWLVAKCENDAEEFHFGKRGIQCYDREEQVWRDYAPSTDWSQGGPILDREWVKLTPRRPFHEDWEAEIRYASGGGTNAFGPTPLIAAMRAYVVSKLGERVEVPEELLP